MANTDILEELKGIPNTLEYINEHPVFKPLLDFRKVISLLKRDENAEQEYLKHATDRLNKLLDKDIYEDSPIAQRYADLLGVYNRIFMIFTKYTEIADETILEMKGLIEKYCSIPLQTQPTQEPKERIRPKPNKIKNELASWENMVAPEIDQIEIDNSEEEEEMKDDEPEPDESIKPLPGEKWSQFFIRYADAKREVNTHPLSMQEAGILWRKYGKKGTKQ